MTEEEKASDKKVKRFDKFLIEILINIIVSVGSNSMPSGETGAD